MTKDDGSFADFKDYDWRHDPIDTVLRGADAGIPTAIKELKRREKELGLPIIDTLSSNTD